jgi:hypothetical protein
VRVLPRVEVQPLRSVGVKSRVRLLGIGRLLA